MYSSEITSQPICQDVFFENTHIPRFGGATDAPTRLRIQQR
jgi:hypothetical protein